MILIAGLHHHKFGLRFPETIDEHEVADWFMRASAQLARLAIFSIDNQIIDASEFSPTVMHATDAHRLLQRLNH